MLSLYLSDWSQILPSTASKVRREAAEFNGVDPEDTITPIPSSSLNKDGFSTLPFQKASQRVAEALQSGELSGREAAVEQDNLRRLTESEWDTEGLEYCTAGNPDPLLQR